MRFHDRQEAGQELAVRVMELAADGRLGNTVVLALPRGGVPVASPVAHALSAPLDVLVVRKIGLPGQPEAGVGAIVGDDPPLFDRRATEMLGLSEDRLGPEVARERIELHRRARLYRGDRPLPNVKDHTVILVDDGLATGVTARAALRHLRRQNPGRIVLAVPVCAPETAATMRSEADDLLCLHQPSAFQAVGQWYDTFDQVGDDEVIDTLQRETSPPKRRAEP